MNKIKIHEALWYIARHLRPEQTVVGSQLRLLMAHALCERSIWRAEIGPIDALTKELYESRQDLYCKHMVRRAASTVFWGDGTAMHRGGRALFDTDVFDMSKPLSEHASRDFLAVVAPIILSHWNNNKFALTPEQLIDLRHSHPSIPCFDGDLETYRWFRGNI